MDAVKYLKELKRMCKTISHCESCPLGKIYETHVFECYTARNKNPEEVVEIVEKWSKENPQKTILQDFFEKYPNANRYEIGIKLCPKDLGYTIGCELEWCGEEMEKCWNRPLEG